MLNEDDLLAIEREYCERSLANFAKRAWHVLEPSAELKWGWALDAICLHLEAVTDGRITRLLMNVPPGSMKSLLTGVIWPAWEWGPKNMPEMRFISTAHEENLAIRDSRKCRDLIKSDWYQSLWSLELAKDLDGKREFGNVKKGIRQARSFTSMTGVRGDRVILDDPISADAANSETKLEAARITFTETLPTRVNSDKSAIVVIMQRLNEIDVSGIILKMGLPYTHLKIPMRYEVEKKIPNAIGWVDPRTKDGELMFPERFNEKQVAELEKTLGSYGTSGQLQQSPSPRGGGILKIKYFEMWPADKALPQFEYILQSWDTAFTEKSTGDPTAFTCWAIFTYQNARHAMLIDAWDEHLSYPELRKRAIQEYGTEYGGMSKENAFHRARRPDRVMIEGKASGQSLIQDLRLANIPVIAYNPGNMDKIARIHQASPILELGLLWIPESAKNRGNFVSWAQAFLKQLEKFPNGEHDDYCDTFSQAIIFLKNDGFFDLPRAKDFDEPPTKSKQRVNPYAV